MSRRPHSCLDLVLPFVNAKVLYKQSKAMDAHDSRGKERMFYVGDTVLAMNFAGAPKWLPGVLEERIDPVSFTVRLRDRCLWKRHVDHLRAQCPQEEESVDNRRPVNMPPQQVVVAPSYPGLPMTPTVPAATAKPEPKETGLVQPGTQGGPVSQPAKCQVTAPTPTPARVLATRAKRVVKPPDRLIEAC